jgi:hypothetical protein
MRRRTEYHISPWLVRGMALVTLAVLVLVALVFWNTLPPAD